MPSRTLAISRGGGQPAKTACLAARRGLGLLAKVGLRAHELWQGLANRLPTSGWMQWLQSMLLIRHDRQSLAIDSYTVAGAAPD